MRAWTTADEHMEGNKADDVEAPMEMAANPLMERNDGGGFSFDGKPLPENDAVISGDGADGATPPNYDQLSEQSPRVQA